MMIRFLISILTVLFLVFSTNVVAGQFDQLPLFGPMMRQITTADGMPSNTIFALTQDRRQYLWIATARGLVRYNGSRYESWQTSPEIPPYAIEALFVDSLDRIWMTLSDHGACVLAVDRDRLTCFSTKSSKKRRLPSDTLFAISETSEGIWLPLVSGDFVLIDLQLLIVVRSMRIDAKTIGVAKFANRLLVLGFEGNIFDVSGSPATARQVYAVKERALAIFNYEGLVVVGLANRAGILIFKVGADGQLIFHKRINTPVRAILAFVAFQDALLAASDQGLIKIGGIEGQPEISWLPANAYAEHAVPDGLISALLVDHQGSLWIASANSGLAFWRADQKAFSWLQKGKNSLPSSHVTFAAMKGSQFWIGTSNDGWYVTNGGKFESVWIKGFGNSTIWGLTSFSGRIWVGHSNGVTILDRFGRQQFRRFADPNDLTLVDLIEPYKESVWLVSGRHNLYNVNERLELLQHYDIQHSAGEIEQFKVSDKKILISGTKGLVLLDRLSGSTQQLLTSSTYAFAQCDFDAQSTYWVVTDQHIVKIDIATMRILKKIMRPTRSADDIGGVYCTETGLLASGAGGLWLVYFDGSSFRLDDPKLAISYEDRPFHVYGNRAFIGSDHGLLQLNIGEIKPTIDHPFHVAIERCCLNPLKLHWRDAPLKLEASSLNFLESLEGQIKFVQRKGNGELLSELPGSSILVSSLSPGEYEFRATASDNHKSFFSEPLRVHVELPPWRRWWGLLLIAMLAYFCFYLIVRAITAARISRRMRQSEIERAQLMMDLASARTDSMSYASHEMKNLLNGVSGNLHLLRQMGTEKMMPAIDRLSTASEGLATLIDDMRDFSKLTRADFSFQPSTIDLRELLDNLVDSQMYSAKQKGLELILTVKLDRPFRKVDPLRLKQILINLISNAIKYAPSGLVNVDVKQLEGDAVCFSVSDNGPGIPVEMHKSIFDPYVRANSDAQGTGLGLAICSEICRKLGGKLALVKADSSGSVFALTVPLEIVEPPSQEALPANNRPNGFLLISKSHDSQETIKEIFASSYHQITICSHFFGVVDLAYTPKIIIIDFDSFECGDLEALDLLARMGKLEDHVIVGLESTNLDCQEALMNHVHAIVDKPYTCGKILEAVTRASQSS